MPLGLLLTLVVGGIGLIALLLHLSGRSSRLRLDVPRARAEWALAFPEDPIQEVWVSGNGQAALVRSDQGTGLIWSFGADCVARLLRKAEVTPTPQGLRVAFHDFTAPAVTLRLTEDERAIWAALLEQT